jgi:hypothetical protein
MSSVLARRKNGICSTSSSSPEENIGGEGHKRWGMPPKMQNGKKKNDKPSSFKTKKVETVNTLKGH